MLLLSSSASLLPSLLFTLLALLPLSTASPLPPQPAQTQLLPALLARQIQPTPSSDPRQLDRRNNAQVPSDATGLTRTVGAASAIAAESSAASSASAAASASSSSAYDNPVYNNFFGAGIPSSMLIYVAAAIAAGVLLSLLLARYFFIKRHYPPTFRAYFIPLNGIHIPFLHLHIDGPPPRPDRRNGPPSYGVSILQRRGRRDRTTRGEGIGEGGRRRGERDGDDGFDGEAAQGEGGREELPMYVLETGLPGYHTVDGEAGTRDGNQLPPALPSSSAGAATTTTLPAYPPPTATSSLPSHNHESGDSLPSVQAYELATRRARDALSPRPSPPPQARPASTRRSTSGTDRNSIGTTTSASSSHTKVEDLDLGHSGSAKDGGEEGLGAGGAGAGGDGYKEEGELEMIERATEPVRTRDEREGEQQSEQEPSREEEAARRER